MKAQVFLCGAAGSSRRSSWSRGVVAAKSRAAERRVECPTTRSTCSRRRSTATPRRRSRRSSSGPPKQIDQWVKQYKDHAEFGYIFRENARDVLNKQNPGSVKATLEHLASLLE